MRLPLLMIIITFLVAAGADSYILSDIRKYSRIRNRRRNTIIYLITVILCWALLIVALCMPRRSNQSDITPIMWMLFTFASIYIPKFIYLICSAIGRLFRCNKNRKPINYGAPVGLFIGIFIFISMWWGVIFTRYDIEVKEVTIESGKIPEEFDGYRIALFSDLHTGTWGNDTSFVAKIVDSINGLNPDMIIFAGDIVNRNTHELQPFRNILKRLHARNGVYAVRGNHDYGDYMDWDAEEAHKANNILLGEWLRAMDWDVLDNTHRFIVRGNDSIAVIGVENWGDPPFKQYGNLKMAYPSEEGRSLNDDNYKILISHNPAHWDMEVSKESNIDLTMSGHTHAMQIMADFGGLHWSPAKWRYEHWGGLYTDSVSSRYPKNLYVNIGSGEVGIPSRVGATPEITLFTLRSVKE